MSVQRIVERGTNSLDGRKRCLLGHRDRPAVFLGWICAQFSSGRRRKVQESNQDNRRRSVGMDGGENRFLGGSDPTLSGMGAAQRLRRRGSLPPKLSNRFPRSVAGRVARREHNDFESLTAEETKR